MSENVSVKRHKSATSTVKKTQYELIALAALVAVWWHVALVLTTGLKFARVDATVNALVNTVIRGGSPVQVNGHNRNDWGWPLTVWIALVVATFALYIGFLFGLKALRNRKIKAKSSDHGLSTAKQLKARISGPEGAELAPAAFRMDNAPVPIRTEDTACTIAPPKWGKTTFMVAGLVKDAPGAVITTSTRPDVLRLTVGKRKDLGKVYVADFDGLSQYPHKVRWDMVAGCADPQVASERASAMVNAIPRSGAPSSADRYFDAGCVLIIQALLHAAALMGGTMRHVVAWSQKFDEHEPANILREKSTAVRAWAGDLDEWCRQNNPDTIGNTKTTLGKIMGPMKSEAVLERLCPTENDPGIDLETFTDSANTLYCLTRVSMNASTAPIVTALVESIVQMAVRKSGSTVSGKLETHLSLVLDEVANTCALPSLPSIMSEGGGNGIHSWVFAQTYSQLVNRWGEEGAETIFDSAAAKVLFGGISDTRLLSKISELIGKHWVEHTSTTSSTGKDGEQSVNVARNMQLDTKMRVDQIRKLSQGKVLLMYRELEAVVDVIPWWERPDADVFRNSRIWCLDAEGISMETAREAAAVEAQSEANEEQLVGQ